MLGWTLNIASKHTLQPLDLFPQRGKWVDVVFEVWVWFCAMSEPEVLNVSNNHEIEGCMLLIIDHDCSFGKNNTGWDLMLSWCDIFPFQSKLTR